MEAGTQPTITPQPQAWVASLCRVGGWSQDQSRTLGQETPSTRHAPHTLQLRQNSGRGSHQEAHAEDWGPPGSQEPVNGPLSRWLLCPATAPQGQTVGSAFQRGTGYGRSKCTARGPGAAARPSA